VAGSAAAVAAVDAAAVVAVDAAPPVYVPEPLAPGIDAVGGVADVFDTSPPVYVPAPLAPKIALLLLEFNCFNTAFFLFITAEPVLPTVFFTEPFPFVAPLTEPTLAKNKAIIKTLFTFLSFFILL
jgi:hypothetical protein